MQLNHRKKKGFVLHTIRGKIILLNVLGMVACLVTIIGAATHTLVRSREQSTNHIMRLACLNEQDALNDQLDGVTGSIEVVSDMLLRNLPDEELLYDREFALMLLERTRPLFDGVASHIDGACTYYLRLAPEYAAEGFLYKRNTAEGQFLAYPLTHIEDFDPDDTAHVGWYYAPIHAGEAVWMEPYYNENLNLYMISYVMPLYLHDTFLGVIGMDVNFRAVADTLDSVHAFTSEQSCLVADDGTVYYHPQLTPGDSLATSIPALSDALQRFSASDDQMLHYTHDGKYYRVVHARLNNGTNLLLSVEENEIRAMTTSLAGTVTVSVLFIAIFLILASMHVAGQITRPLARLRRAADEIARGNLDVQLPPGGDDEVGSLTNTLSVTTRYLKNYISGISERAYTDSLTHVKNKTAYDVALEQLDSGIREGNRDFGIVVFDVNDLKPVNDQCGHDRGDEYLRRCCHLICNVFERSPVYRIGGDEFVVLLDKEQTARREVLMKAMDDAVAATMSHPNPWERCSVAKGIAVCQSEDECAADVFRRADQAMYEDKRRIKGNDVRDNYEEANKTISLSELL